MSNRESARRSRKRKQEHMAVVEKQLESMRADNARLRRELAKASTQRSRLLAGMTQLKDMVKPFLLVTRKLSVRTWFGQGLLRPRYGLQIGFGESLVRLHLWLNVLAAPLTIPYSVPSISILYDNNTYRLRSLQFIRYLVLELFVDLFRPNRQ